MSDQYKDLVGSKVCLGSLGLEETFLRIWMFFFSQSQQKS